MGRKRRNIRADQNDRWIFNRMAAVYDARPSYPGALVDAIAALAEGPRIADLGAGIGHLALPLAARGFEVTAVEPARDMLTELERAARAQELRVNAVHASAEQLPFTAGRFDLVLIADALHFLDSELVGREIQRVLVPRGLLAVVVCELADTPFMNALVEVIGAAAPRRPRDVQQALRQLGALALVDFRGEQTFHDEAAVDAAELERILATVSFIGPAMNPERTAAFRERLRAIPYPPAWARRFTLYWGRRRRSQPSCPA